MCQGLTRVLVVEDDDSLRDAMARALSKAGFQVISASTGTGALESGRESHPDLAIIDVLLPDAGGLGVARELRREIGAVPILFVTGLTLPVMRDALAPAPVLMKPFTRRELLASVRAITRVT
jgi:DNA-binding response OmpR family regulator